MPTDDDREGGAGGGGTGVVVVQIFMPTCEASSFMAYADDASDGANE